MNNIIIYPIIVLFFNSDLETVNMTKEDFVNYLVRNKFLSTVSSLVLDEENEEEVCKEYFNILQLFIFVIIVVI